MEHGCTSQIPIQVVRSKRSRPTDKTLVNIAPDLVMVLSPCVFISLLNDAGVSEVPFELKSVPTLSLCWRPPPSHPTAGKSRQVAIMREAYIQKSRLCSCLIHQWAHAATRLRRLRMFGSRPASLGMHETNLRISGASE